MGLNHFVYSVESAQNTWTTPSRWLWVNSANIGSKRESIAVRTSGVGRVPQQYVLGAKPVNGSVELPFWFTNMVSLFGTFMKSSQITAISAENDFAFLYDDSVLFDTLSCQQIYNSNFGVNILGAAVNQWTLQMNSKEQVKLQLGMLAKDEAECGGTWEDTTASEALLDTPAYGSLQRGFMFYDALLQMGGTPALAEQTKKLSVSGATENATIRACTIAVSHNLDADAFALTRDPTIVYQYAQDRVVDVTLSMPWFDYSNTFYQAARAGTAMALDIALVGVGIGTGSNHAELHVCIPSLFVNPLDLPPIGGDQKTPLISVKANGYLDQVTGVDIGVWIRSTESAL